LFFPSWVPNQVIVKMIGGPAGSLYPHSSAGPPETFTGQHHRSGLDRMANRVPHAAIRDP
jgi:hypothetical protein